MKQDKDKWIENYARFGMAAKGAVYILIGVLATMAAFNNGGQTSGKKGIFQYIYSQPFGQVLLALVAIGLLGYVTWRMLQAIKDPEGKGSDSKGTARRVGYAISGITYAFFAFTAGRMVIQNTGSSGGSGGSGGSGQKQQMLGSLLQSDAGQIAVGAVALVLFGKGIFQIYKAYSGKFSDKIKNSELPRKAQQTLHKAGMVGYTARGVVIGIISYFLMRAAISANPSATRGTSGAFDFLQSAQGPILLAVVAIGLACYGVYMFVKARYRYIPSSM